MWYEERRVVLRRGSLPAWRALVFDQLWPELRRAGTRPLCLLSGLIGAAAEETYLFTGFPDADSWLRCQPLIAGLDPDTASDSGAQRARTDLIAEESARLLRASPVRPKDVTPETDRRAVYGMRRFWIAPGDWPRFVENSANGIWPRIESQDAAILGLFRDAATTDPLECTLLTGYHGPAHWEATRVREQPPADLDPTLVTAETPRRLSRQAMTLRSYVRLMTAHWP
jgi:hypothetical protein